MMAAEYPAIAHGRWTLRGEEIVIVAANLGHGLG